MKTAATAQLRRLVRFLEANRDRLTIDADVHATDLAAISPELRRQYDSTPDYYHGRPITVEQILAEMGMAGVDMALIWQNPAATAYTDDPGENHAALLAANRHIHEAALRHPERFIPAGWTDPRALGIERALDLVKILVAEFGFPIVKLNPAQNGFPIDSEPACAVIDRIVELGAVPAFHFGADSPYTPAVSVERIARRHQACPLLAVHMGGGGAAYPEADALYCEARALGLRCPNLRFVLSAKRDTHIESDLITYELAGDPFRSHLMFGSDAPYGRMTWNFGGARALLQSLTDGARHPDPRLRDFPGLFGPAALRRYLGENAVCFVIEAARRLLAIQAASSPPLSVAAG